MRHTGHLSRAKGFTWLEGVVAIVVILLLVAIIRPAFIQVIGDDRGTTRVLSNAKQIHLALKAYAADHNGRFPEARSSSNEAYRALFPDYLSSKKLFFARGSAWTPELPLEDALNFKTLHPGENHFAYVRGLGMESNPAFPLVAEGFVEGKPGVYSNDPKAKGGRFRGKAAVVVRVDGSGRVERVNSSDYRVYDSAGILPKREIFAPAQGWLTPDQTPLNPAGKED